MDRHFSTSRTAWGPPRIGAKGSAEVRQDAHLESVIPRGFFWALDSSVMCAAFLTAFALAPRQQHAVALGGAFHVQWLAWLVPLPTGSASGFFRPLTEALGALCLTAPVTVLCLWQVRGRNKVSNFDHWVRTDLEYIDTWSLSLDFRILVRTIWIVLVGTGS